jgi:hypothetical protein
VVHVALHSWLQVDSDLYSWISSDWYFQAWATATFTAKDSAKILISCYRLPLTPSRHSGGPVRPNVMPDDGREQGEVFGRQKESLRILRILGNILEGAVRTVVDRAQC